MHVTQYHSPQDFIFTFSSKPIADSFLCEQTISIYARSCDLLAMRMYNLLIMSLCATLLNEHLISTLEDEMCVMGRI